MMRFPRASAALDRLLWRLPPRSRVRQALLLRIARQNLEALNRGDFEVGFARYHPDVELVSDQRMTGLGLDSVYRGHAERISFQERWVAEWGEFSFQPEELVDFGDRVFIHGQIAGSGLASGAGVGSGWAVLATIVRGRVVREEFFFDRDQAFEAAGLSESPGGGS